MQQAVVGPQEEEHGFIVFFIPFFFHISYHSISQETFFLCRWWKKKKTAFVDGCVSESARLGECERARKGDGKKSITSSGGTIFFSRLKNLAFRCVQARPSQ